MLLFAYGIQRTKDAWPTGREWRQLTIFALLNTTLYLGAFVLAMKHVSAGIGSLSTATNPLFIALLSALWLRRRPRLNELGGLLLGLAGVGIATYPLLQSSYATLEGLLILLVGMIAVSAATVYYASVDWRLPNLVINGWQVLLGGLMIVPFTLLVAAVDPTAFQALRFDIRFWTAVGWLVLPVSVAALQLWFYLVRQDAIRASLWLFLCPIFGFAYSYLLLGEPITSYTILGTGLVVGGLWLGRK